MNSTRTLALLLGVAVPCLAIGRLALAVPLILAALMVAASPRRAEFWRSLSGLARTPVGIMLIGMFALWVPSIMVSADWIRSSEAAGRMILFIGAVALVASAVASEEGALSLAERALVAATVVMTAYALLTLTILPELLSFVRGKGWNPISATRVLKEYGSAGILLIPAVLAAGHRAGGGWFRWAMVAAVALLAVIWMTYNRSAMAGLLAAFFVTGLLFVWHRRDRRQMVLFMGTVAALAVATGVWLYLTRGDIQAPEGVPTVLPVWLLDYQRQLIWQVTWDIAQQSPWIGHGINVINFLPGADTPMPGNNLNLIPGHPHSWFFEVLAETGIVGLLPLLGVVAVLTRELGRAYLGSGDAALLAAMAVNVAYWVSGLLSVSFWSSWWQLSFMITLAVCLAGLIMKDRQATAMKLGAR